MSKKYSKAPAEVAQRAASLIKKFHPDLALVGIKIDFLSVAVDQEGEVALSLRGMPCYATVKIVGVKERTQGCGDALITIDEEHYNKMEDPQKDALIDHEIYHLNIVRNVHGIPKKDCRGRPKLKMRKHDIEFGWFNEIATRHGSASIECRQATQLMLTGKQTYFQFALKMKALPLGVEATVTIVD